MCDSVSLDSPAFTGTPTAPTAALGTNDTQIATTAFVHDNTIYNSASTVFPTVRAYTVFQQVVGPTTNDKAIEIVNYGYTGHGASDDIHQNTTALIRVNGRLQLARNVQYDVANSKYITPLQSASAYGSALLELGGEAVILHATPAGVDFSDVPHEILFASANGTDGPTGQRVTSGYFTQTKACIFGRYSSTAYNPSTTDNTWNQVSGTDPMLWLSIGETKGSDNEVVRIEGQSAGPNLFFARSSGTLGSRTIVGTNQAAGGIGWKFYDGANDQRTALIQAATDGSGLSAGTIPASLRFYTSATNSAAITERLRIQSDGYVRVGVSDTATALLYLEASSTTRASLRIAEGSAPNSPNDGDIWKETTNDRLMLRKGSASCEIAAIVQVNSTSPTNPNRTIQLTLNGTTYYIHAKTTND